MKDPNKTISRFLSLVLRHKPGTIGLTLDKNGWADVNELIDRMNSFDHPITIGHLKMIVESNDKQRFIFSEDLRRIRANQGHSVEVDLQLNEQSPPEFLYHGTAIQNLESILEHGILKGNRHHVHLSADMDTAIKVGMRYGKPVVIMVLAKKMSENGVRFFLSENQVWLTEHVSPEYLSPGL